jgi:hypothetical protein
MDYTGRATTGVAPGVLVVEGQPADRADTRVNDVKNIADEVMDAASTSSWGRDLIGQISGLHDFRFLRYHTPQDVSVT